jgi:hypothetical protein
VWLGDIPDDEPVSRNGIIFASWVEEKEPWGLQNELCGIPPFLPPNTHKTLARKPFSMLPSHLQKKMASQEDQKLGAVVRKISSGILAAQGLEGRLQESFNYHRGSLSGI